MPSALTSFLNKQRLTAGALLALVAGTATGAEVWRRHENTPERIVESAADGTTFELAVGAHESLARLARIDIVRMSPAATWNGITMDTERLEAAVDKALQSDQLETVERFADELRHRIPLVDDTAGETLEVQSRHLSEVTTGLRAAADELHDGRRDAALEKIAEVGNALRAYKNRFDPRIVSDEMGDFWLPGTFETRTSDRIESYRRMVASASDTATTQPVRR